MWSDLRLAARSLAKTPVFTAGIIFLLVFSVAASTTIFSLVNVLLLRPLPVRDPDRLVRLVTIRPPLPPHGEFVYEEYNAWRKHVLGFDDVIAWSEHDLFVRAIDGTERARVHFLSDNFFTALGTRPALGRLLMPDDQQPTSGIAPVVLSYAYWKRRFSGNPEVLGRTLEVNGHKVVITGITPKAFNGLTVETGPDLRLPIGWLRLIRPNLYENKIFCEVAARLKAGVSAESVRQHAEAVWQSTWKELNANDPGLPGRFELQSAARGISRMRTQFSGILWLLLGGVMLLLLMVCANVAGLMIARSTGRAGELAVRISLGATRFRLVRQLFCESLLLIAIGTVGAVAVSLAVMPLIVRMLPPVRDLRATRLPVSLDLTPDWRVFGFAVAISTASVLVFGLLPAITAAMRDVHPLLREAWTTHGWRGRQVLIVLQTALSTVLLVGAGLTILTLHRLENLDAGFERSRVVTFSLDPEMAKYTPERATDLQRRLLSRALTLPDLQAAAISSRGLMRGTGFKMTVARAGERAGPEEFMNSSIHAVSPEYFSTMGIPWRAGRNFTGRESPFTTPEPMIVNETFMRRFGGARAVLGAMFGLARVNGAPAKPLLQVIGIVADAKYRSLREPFQPIIYRLPMPGNSFIVHLRTRSAPESVVAPMRKVLAEIDPSLSWIEVNTLESEIEASLWPERAAAFLATLFSAGGAMIAAVGLYALVAFSVIQRHREIGIRMALGAQPRNVIRLMFTRAALLAITGVGVGLVLARAAATQLTTILFEVQPHDAKVLISAAAGVLIVATLAASIPASRGARVDPATVLREQ